MNRALITNITSLIWQNVTTMQIPFTVSYTDSLQGTIIKTLAISIALDASTNQIEDALVNEVINAQPTGAGLNEHDVIVPRFDRG